MSLIQPIELVEDPLIPLFKMVFRPTRRDLNKPEGLNMKRISPLSGVVLTSLAMGTLGSVGMSPNMIYNDSVYDKTETIPVNGDDASVLIKDYFSFKNKEQIYSIVPYHTNKNSDKKSGALIAGASVEASQMKKDDNKVNPEYFSQKIMDFTLPKKAEEVYSFSTDFEFVENTSPKYKYSFNDVLKEYDTSKINKNREMYEF